MRTKFIDMEFPDGTTWRVKAYPVAVERAYSIVDGEGIDEDHPDYENAINDEIEYVLCPDGFEELMRFMENFMYWGDLEKAKIYSVPIKPTYGEWLSSGQYLSKPVVENE
jgi:hypothetical protein